MGAWVRCSRGRVSYTGRISRAPFAAWTGTPEGQAAVDEVASRIRFSLFGKVRAARRRLWRQLADAAREQTLVAVIQSQVQAYLRRLARLTYADALPRAGVDLHRLVVVPRVLLNAAAYRRIESKLTEQPRFAALEGGAALREFFILRLIYEIETAVANANPSPKRPLPAGDDWITVGLNQGFAWRVPVFKEPAWEGHHYVLELTRNPITRAVRKATIASIAGFESSLPSLSRVERNEILRRAVYGA